MHSPYNRLYPLDALRGLAIVVMALDHANFFIAQQHSPGEYWGGPLPAYDSALPFLTRLVTHFAAPGFFFLMGVGMLLFAESRWQQGWDVWKIRAHFWVRGAILIALQFLVENPLWKEGPGFFPETFLGVLAALGGTMILGSFLFRLNAPALLALTLGLLLGTEWLHPDPGQWNRIELARWQLALLHSGGDGEVWSTFSALPWLELVVFGMLFGRWLLADEQSAYQSGLWIGIGLLILFVIVRSADGFGNIRPREGDTWIDYLNVVKYPPSLAFTFLTMGVNLIVLWGFSRAGAPSASSGRRPSASSGRRPSIPFRAQASSGRRPSVTSGRRPSIPFRAQASSGRRPSVPFRSQTGSGQVFQTVIRPLVAFGSAPLFVYVLHLYLYMLMGRYFEPFGTSLPVMYLYWLAGLAILYLPALWYGRFKQYQTPLRGILAYL